MNTGSVQAQTDAAVIAAVVSNEHVLVIRQPDKNNPQWKFPGGGVEEGETVGAALHREVKEETTLDIFAEGIRIIPLGFREVTTRRGVHEQHLFLILVKDPKDILYLNGLRLKEDEDEIIEVGIRKVAELSSMTDFLRPQLPILQKVLDTLDEMKLL